MRHQTGSNGVCQCSHGIGVIGSNACSDTHETSIAAVTIIAYGSIDNIVIPHTIDGIACRRTNVEYIIASAILARQCPLSETLCSVFGIEVSTGYIAFTKGQCQCAIVGIFTE